MYLSPLRLCACIHTGAAQSLLRGSQLGAQAVRTDSAADVAQAATGSHTATGVPCKDALDESMEYEGLTAAVAPTSAWSLACP